MILKPRCGVVPARAGIAVIGLTPVDSDAMVLAQITEDEVGKTVVAANGDEVGIVSAVEHGTAYVDPDPELTTKLKAKLGWEDRDDAEYPLQEEAVETVTDDEVRLQSDL